MVQKVHTLNKIRVENVLIFKKSEHSSANIEKSGEARPMRSELGCGSREAVVSSLTMTHMDKTGFTIYNNIWVSIGAKWSDREDHPGRQTGL